MTANLMRLLSADPTVRPDARAAAALLRKVSVPDPGDERPTRFVPPLDDGSWGSAARWDPERFAPVEKDAFDAPSYHATRGDTGRHDRPPLPPPPPPPPPPVVIPPPSKWDDDGFGSLWADDDRAYDRRPRERRRRAPFVIAAIAFFLVAALVAGGLIWRSRHQMHPVARTSSAAPDFMVYQAPGGFTVHGPYKWNAIRRPSAVADQTDIVRLGRTREADGGYRIGIGFIRSSGDIQTDLSATKKYIATPNKNNYSSVTFIDPTPPGTFLNHPSADIEYTATDSEGRRRHVRERLWLVHGQQLIINVDAPDEQRWQQLLPGYETMLATCKEDV